MFDRPQLRIHWIPFQNMVEAFTLSKRMWTAYTPDKFEHIMNFYHLLPEGFLYSRYDTEKEELVFLGPIFHTSLPQSTQLMTAVKQGKVKYLTSGG